jgi:hypothetical protein
MSYANSIHHSELDRPASQPSPPPFCREQSSLHFVLIARCNHQPQYIHPSCLNICDFSILIPLDYLIKIQYDLVSSGY